MFILKHIFHPFCWVFDSTTMILKVVIHRSDQSFSRVPLFSTPWITACQASVSSSFRIDWLDLLSIQGTLKSLLQHYSSKASILQCLAFFIVQRSYPYMITGKTIALTRRTFVGKVMSLPPVFIYLENIHRFILLYKNS